MDPKESWVMRVDQSLSADSVITKDGVAVLRIIPKASEAVRESDTLFLAIEKRSGQNAGIFAVAKVIKKLGSEIIIQIDQTKLKGGKREFINESALVREDMFKSWNISELPSMQPIRLD